MFDYVLVGGGLQNGLIALALRARDRNVRIALVERGGHIGGNHTWCFHAGDLPQNAAAWIDPLVVARWPGYDVRFLGLERSLDSSYACISSERLAERVIEALDVPGSALLLGTTALQLTPDSVTVRDANDRVRELSAAAVIDARGPDALVPGACGWQKFVGQEIECASPHGLERPMLMDATVPQRDGFRFFYVLPLDARRLLVEDTYFSDGSRLEVETVRGEIASYATARGWSIARVLREETGVLPMPWQCEPPSIAAPLVAGYAGGWFHPVTGYSFPIAARVAATIASVPPQGLHGPELAALAGQQRRQLRFALLLTKMMFRWFPSAERHRVLERFYRLDEALIRRFYALEITAGDRARILFGRPPRGMSFRAALGLSEVS